MEPSTPISDERAVEASQTGQSGQANISPANVGYYEPDKLADLAKNGRLYVIADGVSGGTSGQVAGRYVIQKILHDFYTHDSLDPKTRLLDLIQRINREIFERNTQHPERRPLATTLTVALIHKNKLLMTNVGDSRAYVVWGQDIERVDWDAEPPPSVEPDNAPVLLLPTRSRTPTETKIKKVNPDSHQQRIPAALGLEKSVKIQTFTRRLFPADIVVLCSGGLSGYITEKEIARAVSRYAPDEAVPRLIALAAERGNYDSVAISITRVLSSAVALRPPKAMPLPDAPQWSKLETEIAAPAKPLATDTQKSTQPPPVPSPAPASTVTQPMVASKPVAKATTQTPPRYIPQKRGRRWPGCLLAILLVLILCAAPVLAWQYLVPADMLASIPYLSNIEAALTGSAESLGVDLPTEEAVTPASTGATEIAQTASGETAPAQTITPVESAIPEATASPQVTLVTESNSPVAMPETIFNSPVSTPTVTPTPTPEALPTPSPTPLPTIELPADCGNRGRFRRDVTIPDGTQFEPGQAFEKIWLILNADTCPWGPGYTVRHIGGDLMGAPPEVPLVDIIAPDTNGEISVPMIAPATSGQYRGEWQLYDLHGEAFGPVMYLEIEVVAPEAGDVTGPDVNILYDFIENANQANWSAGGESYTVQETEISEALALPFPQGVVAKGTALLRGNVQSQGDILLTYPHLETGTIEGSYTIDTPLEPTDILALELGFPKLSILSDDGVTFEITFTPNGGASEQVIVSKTVQYSDSPVSEAVPLSVVQSGQTGTFTLRVLGGNSLSQDWAVWIKAQLVRP